MGKTEDQVFGVEWNQTEAPDGKWTRIDRYGNSVSLEDSDFNSLLPWCLMKRVNLAPDGTINAVYGDPDYTNDGSNGRVMVQIPRFYVRAQKSIVGGDTVYRRWISFKNRKNFDVNPVFNMRTNNPPADFYYVGAYEADGYDDGTFKLHSRTGKQPVTGEVSYPGLPNGGELTIGQSRDYANNINIGSNWGQFSWWTLSALQTLNMIEYGNLNSQSNIGKGIVDKDWTGDFNGENTGYDDIDNQIPPNGTGSGTGTDGLTPIAYRWIENPWGNTWTFVDGYNAIDAEYRLINRDGTGTFKDTLDGDNYEASHVSPITYNDGYVKNIEFEELLKYTLIPANVDGSDDTYIPDKWYVHDTGEINIALSGGHWPSGSLAGLVYVYSPRVSSSSYCYLGCRVEFAK